MADIEQDTSEADKNLPDLPNDKAEAVGAVLIFQIRNNIQGIKMSQVPSIVSKACYSSIRPLISGYEENIYIESLVNASVEISGYKKSGEEWKQNRYNFSSVDAFLDRAIEYVSYNFMNSADGSDSAAYISTESKKELLRVARLGKTYKSMEGKNIIDIAGFAVKTVQKLAQETHSVLKESARVMGLDIQSLSGTEDKYSAKGEKAQTLEEKLVVDKTPTTDVTDVADNDNYWFNVAKKYFEGLDDSNKENILSFLTSENMGEPGSDNAVMTESEQRKHKDSANKGRSLLDQVFKSDTFKFEDREDMESFMSAIKELSSSRLEEMEKKFTKTQSQKQISSSKDISFLAIDGDDIGDLVVEYVYKNDVEAAKKVSEQIKKANSDIISKIKSVGGEIIFDGGDNILATIKITDAEQLEAFGQELINLYKSTTGHTATVGVADNQVDAQKSLVLGKNSGKNRVVQWDDKLDPYWEEVLAYLDRLKDNKLELKIDADFWREGLESEKRYSSEMRKHLKENVFHKHGIDIDAAEDEVKKRELHYREIPTNELWTLTQGKIITFDGKRQQKQEVVDNTYDEETKTTTGELKIVPLNPAGRGKPKPIQYSALSHSRVEEILDYKVDESGKPIDLSEIKRLDWVADKETGNSGQVKDIVDTANDRQYTIEWVHPVTEVIVNGRYQNLNDYYKPHSRADYISTVGSKSIQKLFAAYKPYVGEEDNNFYTKNKTAEGVEKTYEDFKTAADKIWTSKQSPDIKAVDFKKILIMIDSALSFYGKNQIHYPNKFIKLADFLHLITTTKKSEIPEDGAANDLLAARKKYMESLNTPKEQPQTQQAPAKVEPTYQPGSRYEKKFKPGYEWREVSKPGVKKKRFSSLEEYGWMFSRNAHIQKFMYENDIDFLTIESELNDKQKEYAVMELEAYLEETRKSIEAMTHEEIVDFINKLPVGGI